MTTPPDTSPAPALDSLWHELLWQACSSDGPIADNDVREAIRFYRPRIEAEARQQAVERMQAMRRDYRTMPHAQFPIKWADWKDYDEVLPTNCSCQECRLWRSG